MNKKNILLYVVILLFGLMGSYLTFFVGNTKKYDSQTRAYEIYENERSDSDGSMYYPIYYFKVNGKEYECKSNSGSSFIPNKNKNIVYYDSSNPEKCITQYEQSTGKFIGIILLIVTGLIIFFAVKKPSKKLDSYSGVEKIDIEKQQQIEAKVQKVINIAEKIGLIYKRVIIGIIIVVLLIFILVDVGIIKQTIKSKDYIDVVASYEDKKENSESNVFDDYIYTFKDKNGKDQKITVSVSKEDTPKDEIKIKYNENNPNDYYEESAIMNKSKIIWFVVEVVIEILLILLFFNKKILNKINLFASVN